MKTKLSLEGFSEIPQFRQQENRHDRGREQIVRRDVEKALDLPRVEIDRQDAVGPRAKGAP